MDGFAASQALVGNAYYNGKVVERDYAEALKWYRLAAAQSNAEGQNGLGLMYYHGLGGLTEDRSKAKELWIEAAQSGSPAARANLHDDFGFNLATDLPRRPATKDNTYADQKLGFQIAFPSYWTQTTGAPETGAVKGVSPPGDDRVYVKVRVYDLPTGMTLDHMNGMWKNSLIKQGEVVKDTVAVKVNEIPAFKITSTAGAGAIHFEEYVLIAPNHRGYVITAGGTVLDYWNHTDEIKRIVGSFSAM